MDGNGNQRKRGGRLAKNSNNNEPQSPAATAELNEVMEVSAVAISPTLEEAETTTSAPASECRRSSRKKIIKFDVRDLLNKNRKTHKIQIEARIDSNAPTTSKANTAGGNEVGNSKAATNVREDLLSKQKTFLEKSAIFRRYSISQEHKPPPPPLPIPPLLGKTNDNKDASFSASSSSRRLSRTQEFFSNVMIKPKQTTSLIVAQIESSTPSTTTSTAKRKSLNKLLELETKAGATNDAEISPTGQLKKRGRPPKFKTQTSSDAVVSTAAQEDVPKKKITPEKAKNWKEYKACLAQQSGSQQEDLEEFKSLKESAQSTPLKWKQSENVSNMALTLEDTQQSDISKSEDDDGSFSGFKTSKEDLSCDSPAIGNDLKEKLFTVEALTESKGKLKMLKSKTSLKTEALSEKPVVELDIKVSKEETSSSEQLASEEKVTKDINSLKDSSLTAKPETISIESEDDGKEKQTITLKQDEIIETNIANLLQDDKNVKDSLPSRRSTRKSPEIFKNKDTEMKNASITRRSQVKSPVVVETKTKEEIKIDKNYDKVETLEITSIQPNTSETIDNNVTKQPIRSTRRQLRKDDIKETPTKSEELMENKTKPTTTKLEEKVPKITQETPKEAKQETPQTEVQTIEKEELKSSDILSKTAEQILDECTPETKLSDADILLLTSQTQPSTPSQGSIKTYSRTSSSSESENASERSSYSSDPSSGTSSSGRSYKSGDKLRVSLKRISLPKSPSTSSQTSTSEELNSNAISSNVLKKKPPLAKRSKRLQKKFVEMLENQNDSEDSKIEQVSLSEDENNSNEIIAQTLAMIEAPQETAESCIVSENLDSNSNDSINTKIVKGNMGKRKSLRNRKNNSNEENDNESDKSNATDKETLEDKEVEIKQQLQIKLTDLKQKNLGKDKEVEGQQEIPKDIEKTLELQKTAAIDEPSDESNDSQQIKKFKNEQPIKKQPPRKLKKQTSLEVTATLQEESTKEKLETEVILENKEQMLAKLSGKDKASLRNKSTAEEHTNETSATTIERVASPSTEKFEKQEIPTTRSKTNKQVTEIKNQAEEIDETQIREISMTGYSKQSSEEKVEKDKSVATETSDSSACITNNSEISRQPEKTSKIPTTRSKTNKEDSNVSQAENLASIEPSISSQNFSKRKAQQKTEIVPDVNDTETSKIATDPNNSDKEKLNTNNEEIYEEEAQNSTFNLTTRSKTIKATISKITEEKPIANEDLAKSEINQEKSVETTTKRSKSPKEKSNKSDEISNISTTRSKTNKEQISLKESEVPAVIINEIPKQEESMQQQTSLSTKERSKSPKEKVSSTKEEISEELQLEVTKLTPNRRKNNKEDSSVAKEELIQEQSSAITKLRSQSPKDINLAINKDKSKETLEKAPKITPNRRKTYEEDTSAMKDVIMQTKENTQSTTEKMTTSNDEESSTSLEKTSKITSSKKKTNRENITATTEGIMTEKSSETTKERSKSPKEKTNDEQIIDSQDKTHATTRRSNNKDDDLKPEQSCESLKERSQSPKEEIDKTDEAKSKDLHEKTSKIITTRRRNIKEDTSNSKMEIMQELSSESIKEGSQSPKEKIDKTDEAISNNSQKKTPKIATNRKRNVKEDALNTKQELTQELSSESTKERSLSPKVKLTKTIEENSADGKDKKEETSTEEKPAVIDETIISENKEQQNSLESNKTTTECSKTPEEESAEKQLKHEQITTTRRSKEKANESPSEKPMADEMHAETSKAAMETIVSAGTQESKDLTPSENLETNSSTFINSKLHAESLKLSQTIEDKTHEIITRDTSKSPTCSKVQQTSLAKRKSLRNQKDSNTTEITPESTSETAQESSLTLQTQQETSSKEKQEHEESIKITKRKGRKSRFKNLYGPDIESETDSNNGKCTPIEEIIQHKFKEQPSTSAKENLEEEKQEVPQVTKEADKASEIEVNPSDIQSQQSVASGNEQSANLLSSQIQNVSIETNTLLDILRRVQSNTEAALKACKVESSNPKTEIDNNSETSAKVQIEENVKTSQDLSETSKESNTVLTKAEEDSTNTQETKHSSPARSCTESPLTLKKINLSPARSESASPLTLKKITQSPTRSDSSSPLTLKKVTRRYERRSRRGEDSDHKTLEETFAEIAAQSSKAVLAAKEFDINEEQNTSENSQLELNTLTNTGTEQIEEIFTKIESDPNTQTASDPQVQTLNVEENVDKRAEDLQNVSQLPEETGKVTEVTEPAEIEKPTVENVVEESTKVTPARRGRKPKNRALEVPLAKEDIDIGSPTKAKEVIDESLKEAECRAQKPSDEKTPNEEEKVENKTIKSKKTKAISSLTTPELAQTEETPESLKEAQPQLPETCDLSQINTDCSLKPCDEANECKVSKKSNKKRDTSKGESIAEDSAILDNLPAKDKEDEVRTPKQAAKKRDTSQTKSETKTAGKKLTKKTKNEEEDDTSVKTNPTTITTTPPPSKRGRKPKNQQQETPQTSTGSKKKNKKELQAEQNEELNEDKRKTIDSESESLNSSLDRSLDDKLAKKKRQKKLKEAFEAALTDDTETKNKETLKTEVPSTSNISNFGLTLLNNSPPPERRVSNDMPAVASKITCVTPVEADEDPDPLKDIEKFIADGVNLLKKDYKLDEDSVDDVIPPNTTTTAIDVAEEPMKEENNEEIKPVFNTFETPADTPINTPSVTPPPKSPTSIESSTPDEISGVRRSHRIKLITKTPKALVGRGLVKDKERFSIKDDVETKSHYTLDDHLTDLAEVEAKNAKFLKEMEERLSNFQVIKENEYLCERVISREARKMICDCFLTHEEEERGELGCGEDCLNRLLMIECGAECNVKERCTNKRFQKLLCSPCRVFRTEKKGFGIMADIEILPGEFIMEYVGEVIDTDEFEKRRIMYSQDKNRHYYFMALRSDAIIDATIKGNISRFINHSCDPNAETQKWTVNGELRIGFFSRKSIMPGEEITFNYQYQRYGREAQRCYCESANCTGWIGQEPTSDEGEQLDDDDEYEESEEEADTSNLLVQDDDEDSDASEADPEEVQKQLEMAAAQAEVELAPLQLLEGKAKREESAPKEEETHKSESEEDSKSKFKKLLSKMAEKVAAKQKQNKREQKMQRKKKSKESSTDLSNKLRFLEDPDIEDEVGFLKECGLKNQSDTLRLSRLMVRAKLVQTRLNLLEILRQGDLPCRRLFLDYHGLRLLHGWMSEDAGNMQIRLALLQTLETLPIANKTVLTDSKVMQVVRNWCGQNSNLSPNEDSSSSNSNSQDVPVQAAANFEEGSDLAELQKLAVKLITTWEGLPEIFRIPKKERIEQMKEHEREADRQYAANAETQENTNTTAIDRYRRDRFGRDNSTTASSTSGRFVKPNNGNPHRTNNTTPENNKNLSKAQRREMFAAKVARDEAEKRLAEERREFETKCRFFGLDPKKTRQQDIPFCVNPATGQWFSIERKPINTPPSYAHVQVPVKPKSTDPNDYQLPAVCSTLPPQWKYAITPQGKIYYYHIKNRIPQWEPPTPAQLQQCEMEARDDDSESELTTTAGEDSSDDDDEVLIGMDAAQLKAYIDRKVEMRRQKRYQRLVVERSISPRREEDRIYNQMEVRKYKENKEKIRKRKEEIRRKRAEALRQTSLNMCTLGSINETNPNTQKTQIESPEDQGVLPIQDYLLSSDEEVDLKVEVNSPLMDKIVEGDKIVDELDALTTKRQLKRPLPPHRDLNEPSTSSSPASTSGLNVLIARQEYKKRKLEKKEKRKPKEQDAKYRKNKEKFRCEIAGIIVHHLKPYRKETCTVGRIQSNEDFNHLARKLTHFVMIKELKYCESVGQTLVVTESVKSKSREFIKKYMAKYTDVYVKPSNDPDFKDIPFTL
ncbi:probable histone-lysine N-methyltransferase CG1716 isoform X2 [Lucilia cuprina]|uniref:probable histone-lysine N-methyltransferase CG1716 isoform X2 n=1 Tax=Lucilia cuprina TaxID=7375 RepID=UPI001F06A866|nr:probable histone-lysine N-methyltransferase CG1716 isoform X2 [Lucilia cuprina]